ncbi:MAG: T6SS immunity protein Tdi1 domain-containing protein [Pseudomonadota bacterium]
MEIHKPRYSLQMALLEQVNEAWGWAGLEAKQLLAKNDFGNLILSDKDFRCWRICPEELSCEVVADNHASFAKLLDTQEFSADWKVSGLVDLAYKSLGRLEPDQVYYLVIPAVLGGSYDVKNIKKISIMELVSTAGSLAKQIKDLPDGNAVELVIKD